MGCMTVDMVGGITSLTLGIIAIRRDGTESGAMAGGMALLDIITP